MNWHDLHRETAARLKGYQALADERPFIYIDSHQQQLHCIELESANDRCYPVSTARNGMGNRVDSYKTPLGLHRISHKIGGDQPSGAVFVGREPTGRIATDLDNREHDEITSRILWLDGLEEGVNQGGEVDTHARYIYIHGTSDEKRIGEPVSAGCIRMRNEDVIELFDHALVNDLVIIK